MSARNRIFGLLLACLAALTPCARAQGGPPFITDDPGTPGNRQWEVNLLWTGNHNPGSSSYQLPDVDINYGLGERLQLKFELPLAAATDAHRTTRAGVGESQLGIKWRYFEHHTAGLPKSDETLRFSLGTFPQLVLNNPTSSVRRGIVETGPQYYLPVEFTARLGPLRINGEVGRWIGNRHVSGRWGRGLIAGHEFSQNFELFGELYDLQDIQRIGGDPKARQFTAGLGGRRSLGRDNRVRLLFMGGRSLQRVSRTNGEPNWIACLGMQFLLGTKK
jgi:hypothetical protein